jgi:hypothetical protein
MKGEELKTDTQKQDLTATWKKGERLPSVTGNSFSPLPGGNGK